MVGQMRLGESGGVRRRLSFSILSLSAACSVGSLVNLPGCIASSSGIADLR